MWCYGRFWERGLLLANLEKLLSFNKEEARKEASMQGSLFGSLPSEKNIKPRLDEGVEISQNEKLSWEKELLGLYISEHPFNFFKPYLDGYALPLRNLSGHKNDPRVTTAGIVSSMKKIVTRKGDSMIFVRLEDALSSTELLIFPKLYQETIELWEEGKAIIVAGKISDKDQDIKILADKVGELQIENPKESINDFKKIMSQIPIVRRRYGGGYNNTASTKNVGAKMVSSEDKKVELKEVDDAVLPNLKSLRISLKENFSAADLLNLKEIFKNNLGDDEVFFRLLKDNKYKIIKTDFKVKNNDDLKKEINQKFKDIITISS